MSRKNQLLVSGTILTILSLIFIPFYVSIIRTNSNTLKTKIISSIIILVLIIGATICFVASYFNKKNSNPEIENKKTKTEKSNPGLSVIIALGLILLFLVVILVMFFTTISE